MSGPVMIMAGGTGGHVFPALAVACALRDLDHTVVWLGTPRGLENVLVPRAGFHLEHISVAGVRGKGLATWLLAPLVVLRAIAQAWRILRRCRPIVVLGMGGFAAGPGGIAAWLLRRPLVIHEQNAVAGLTNRLLAGFAREVLQAFPGSFSARVRARTVGNPIRSEIAALPAPGERMAVRSGPVRLLVLGGSQGALFLNETVPQALAELRCERPEVCHQTGEATMDRARTAYDTAGVTAQIVPFIDDMAASYAWADLVICRAGALTISELAGAGIGAILVPFPAAVDDHQTRNAEFMVEVGAATIVQESELDARGLADILEALCTDRQQLVRRAENARSLARPEATDTLVDTCLKWALA